MEWRVSVFSGAIYISPSRHSNAYDRLNNLLISYIRIVTILRLSQSRWTWRLKSSSEAQEADSDEMTYTVDMDNLNYDSLQHDQRVGENWKLRSVKCHSSR